jgi:hypothetical protein
MKDQPPYKYKGWRPIESTTIDILIIQHLSFIFYLTFPIYYCFFVLRCCWWLLVQRRRSSRAVSPARVAHSCHTPRRGPSWACGVSGIKRPRRLSCVSRFRRGSSGDVSCVSRSSLEAQGPGVDTPRCWPIPKSAMPYIERSSSLSSVWPNLASTSSVANLPYTLM